MMQQLNRPRRNRRSAAIRDIVQENQLLVTDLLYPLFLLPGTKQQIPIQSMPGINRSTLDFMLIEIEECVKLGIRAYAIFPVVPDNFKDKQATFAFDEENFYLNALRTIKTHFPTIAIMTDVALDPYSSDGHDGLVIDNEINNDLTLPLLAQMAVMQAKAGADIIGPSDMMDGRVGFIRSALDKQGFYNTNIMSYTAKYASAFYGPFRDALDSAPKFGDKKTYQMNPANVTEALFEAELDCQEGADIIMVKPALAYLDIISLLKKQIKRPIAAYNVSGEYAMVCAAAAKGWIEYERTYLEVLLGIKRAGASIILTYFAKDAAKYLKS